MNSQTIPKNKLNKELIFTSLIGVFLLLTYVFGLIIPVTSDAGKYAAISRIIYETGDWINLKIHFEPYLQKPPLLFWITTPFYFLFGPSAFAFKLPVFLFSGIAIYSTYRFAKIYYSEQTARLAALMLATCEFYFLFHNDIHTDSLLTANVIFSIWQLAEYFNSKKLANILLASLGVGLAMISKGPIGIFVPVTAAFTHLLFKRQLKQLLSYKTILAIILLGIILFVGLTGLYNQFGWEGIQFFFWDNNAGRISGKIKGNSTDYLFYFHTTLYIFLPWGFLFFIALIYELKTRFQQKWKNQKHDELFTLGGLLFYWIIISIAKAKAPHYFMVLSPFMAIISAKWIILFFNSNTYFKIRKAVIITQYVVIIALWILLFILCAYCFPSRNIYFWTAIFILIILSFIQLNKTKLYSIIARSIIAIVAINFALNAHIFVQLFNYQSVIPACTVFNNQAKEGEKLNTYLSEHRELFFYAENPGYYLYDSDDLKKCLKKSNDWIYTNDKGIEEIKSYGTEFTLVKSFKHRSVSKLTAKYLNPKTRNKSLKNMYLIKLTSSP